MAIDQKMGKTFAEKILALKSVSRSDTLSVKSGEIVTVSPDIIMSHDNSAAISGIFKKIGIHRVMNPEKVVIILDHCVPPATEKYAENHKIIREFVRQQDIKNFYDINTGICHQVLPEKGYALPGTLILGSDSHTTTYGAFGAFAAGIGRTETAALWATDQLWLKCPQTIKIIITGKLKEFVTPKDIILYIIGDLGADGALYKAVEFTGETIANMSISGRMTLCNMSAEMGAKIAYCKPDDKTKDWLANHNILTSELCPPTSDPDAEYEKILEYNIDNLEPQIACPHTVDNVRPVKEVQGTKFHQALIGTCANGRIEDLEIAANILTGKKIAKDTRLLIFPASIEVYKDALKLGILEKLIDSGAVIMNPGCGPCLGAHQGILAPGEVCISTANRNFKGRMGCEDAEIYLASPSTVAASAIKGEITNPGDLSF